MNLVEYEDCIVAEYSRLSDDEIGKQADWFNVDLQVINGLRSEVEVAARPKGDGMYEVLAVLLDKSLQPHDITSIAGLVWHVFAPSRQDLQLPPLVAAWGGGRRHCRRVPGGRLWWEARDLPPPAG